MLQFQKLFTKKKLYTDIQLYKLYSYNVISLGEDVAELVLA